MIEMCPLSEKADALSAITLVEMTAMLSTGECFARHFSVLRLVSNVRSESVRGCLLWTC